jgi:hypothetical protein
MKTTPNLTAQLTAAQAARARRESGHPYYATEGPWSALPHSLTLNLTTGAIYRRSVDLGATFPPDSPEDVQAVYDALQGIAKTPCGHTEWRAAIREALGDLCRERRRGPEPQYTDTITARCTDAQMSTALRLGEGNAGEGVRRALDAAGEKLSPA